MSRLDEKINEHFAGLVERKDRVKAMKGTDAYAAIGIQFSWEYDATGTRNDRVFSTGRGWKIVLSRGLDIFQRLDLNEASNFANRM